ncbi:MAG: ATP-binding protein, partial [Pseudomonadota bacterium]
DGGEQAEMTDVGAMMHQIQAELERDGIACELAVDAPLVVKVKANALKRCVSNLVHNAGRHAQTVRVAAGFVGHELLIVVEDDGPGIAEHDREEVFRPFVRLDDARNQDDTGSGLGLTIALDIARSHGGELNLSDSSLGGLKASIRIPV